MKATLAKDLVIGAIYSDIRGLNEDATLLIYRGKRNGYFAFERVGGDDSYINSTLKDGTIPFKGINPFYELSPSEIEQYLPTPPKG